MSNKQLHFVRKFWPFISFLNAKMKIGHAWNPSLLLITFLYQFLCFKNVWNLGDRHLKINSPMLGNNLLVIYVKYKEIYLANFCLNSEIFQNLRFEATAQHLSCLGPQEVFVQIFSCNFCCLFIHLIACNCCSTATPNPSI